MKNRLFIVSVNETGEFDPANFKGLPIEYEDSIDYSTLGEMVKYVAKILKENTPK